MSGNRVEQLESRVEELEASVDGLTEELMQTKARLADLEDESTDEYIEAGVGSVSEESDVDSSANEGDNSTERDSQNTEPPEADDIIVA